MRRVMDMENQLSAISHQPSAQNQGDLMADV